MKDQLEKLQIALRQSEERCNILEMHQKFLNDLLGTSPAIIFSGNSEGVTTYISSNVSFVRRIRP